MKKGFTLIELMIVILIVGILAAVAVPLMTSRIEKAKYSEGKAMASQVATALRAHVAEYGTGNYDLVADLGFASNELDGKYFKQGGITTPITGTLNGDGTVSYTITCAADTSANVSHGPVTLQCIANVTNFTSPTGL